MTFERKVSATKKQLASLLLFLTMALVVTSGLAVPAYAADSDFEVENGVLKKYTGASVDVVIPDGVTEIDRYAFGFSDIHTTLRSVVIPEGVTEIPKMCFNSSLALERVVLPQSLASIGNGAFSHAESLKEINLPSGLKTIEYDAFSGCEALTSITIPDSVTIPEGVEVIDFRAFEGCTNLKTATILGANAKAAETTNTGAQNYNAYHADPIRSYLYQRGDGNFTRVEWPKYQSYVVVEVYDRNFNLLTHKEIPTKLKIWGGFFAGEQYNFLIFGDYNSEDDPQKEVVRVVKYSKDWERLDSWSGIGMYTSLPFSSATVRCAGKDGILTIRTAHTQFKKGDGAAHQINRAYSIRESDMTWVTCAGSSSFSVVSHSMNQFVLVEEDGVMATLDHGDASPRAFVVNIHPDYRRTVDSFETAFGLSEAASVPLVYSPYIQGKHYNYTNAQAGGFEASSTHYLASVTLEAGLDKNGGSVSDKGIMVYAVDKKTRAVSKYQITAEENLSNTQLVKLSGDKLLLLWETRVRISEMS